MLLKTQILWDEFWDYISTTEHGWQNTRHYKSWIEDQDEVNSFAEETWITKINDDEPFGPTNCQLINVWHDGDYDKILRGVYRLEGFSNDE